MGTSEGAGVEEVLHAGMRRAERRSTRAPSTLRTDGMRPIDVTVVDVSTTGLGVETSEDLRISDEISIGLPGVGTRRAFIAWRRDNRYGCAFYSPLDESDLARAFLGANLVPLGTPQQALVATPSVTRAPEVEHDHWWLPLDAILVTLAYLGAAGFGLWHLLG
jgi:hypothetical protein